ncbi:MAG TPA: Asp23/Gls24 family envelope stress response protein [Lactovum miscens]|uniref:Asp23/Gls24 family envelope stress response protein n=1 Tax=Lactovum miscens TaxID=190387 RepID=UPI002EDBAE9C
MAELENLGEVVIAPEVLEVIIGVSASKVDGVYSLRNKRTFETLGKKAEGKGVYIKAEDESISVDIYIFVTEGARVPEVAQNIQREVKERVLGLTEVVIDNVNVHIMGIIPADTKKPDFADLFKEGFFDAN